MNRPPDARHVLILSMPIEGSSMQSIGRAADTGKPDRAQVSTQRR